MRARLGKRGPVPARMGSRQEAGPQSAYTAFIAGRVAPNGSGAREPGAREVADSLYARPYPLA